MCNTLLKHPSTQAFKHSTILEKRPIRAKEQLPIISSITVLIQNSTDSKLYAHVTGRDLEKNLSAVKENGHDVYRPTSPVNTHGELEEKIAIAVDSKAHLAIRVPQMEGERIWFSKKKPLEIFLNPGPAFVEPAVNDVFDVKRIPSDGLATIRSKLEKQGGGWERLVVRSLSGDILRAIGPNLGQKSIPEFAKDMERYFQRHIYEVWGKYGSEDLEVDTQGLKGVVKGRVKDGQLCSAGIAFFVQPSFRDIFSCDTGPFAGGAGVSPEQLNIGARIAAATNRSTRYSNPAQPHGEKVENYYKENVTNYYARICHEVNIDHLGYASPYDDVHPSAEGTIQEGSVNETKPKSLRITVGGGRNSPS
jgi:hypothetical protein